MYIFCEENYAIIIYYVTFSHLFCFLFIHWHCTYFYLVDFYYVSHFIQFNPMMVNYWYYANIINISYSHRSTHSTEKQDPDERVSLHADSDPLVAFCAGVLCTELTTKGSKSAIKGSEACFSVGCVNQWREGSSTKVPYVIPRPGVPRHISKWNCIIFISRYSLSINSSIWWIVVD